MLHLLSLRLRVVFCTTFGILAVVACSSGGSDGFVAEDAGASPTDSGSGHEASSSGAPTTVSDAATSCHDPTCARAMCVCKDDTIFSPAGVCRKDNACDFLGACDEACGSAGSDGTLRTQKQCTKPTDCPTAAQPTECTCKEGFGANAFPTCFEGYCSPEKEHVCPKACASMGGWACTNALDCAPIICPCKDGKNPVAAPPCSGGTCSDASTVCSTACSTHGGWSGTPTSPADAGPTGPTAPGESCTKASECMPFDCTCNNGSTYDNTKICEGKVCATKASTCTFVCSSDGGWSGT